MAARTGKTIEDMQQVAASRGGLCLAEGYHGKAVALEWQCAQGHRWQATPAAVTRAKASWCPVCSRAHRSDNLELMQKVAAERGGCCVSDEYLGALKPLEWVCAKGHHWYATPASVKHRTWCPQCANEQRRRYTIEAMRELAGRHGGACLSPSYANTTTPLRWRCASGHEWSATPSSVLQGTWCRQCYHDCMRSDLEAMRALAASRDGRCLSTRYVDAHTPLRWQCSQGHTWEAVPHSVIDGRWCRQCASLKVHACTIEQLHELARAHGGECLSSEYRGIVTPLSWQCACGRVWRSRPKTVLGGGWCPACFRRSRYAYTIHDMQELARARGGKCLSEEYLGAAVKLAWECTRGHTWTTKPGTVLAGHWCPACKCMDQCVTDNARRKYQADEMRGGK